MITAAFDEAGARDPLHLRTWVVLIDGAECFHLAREHQRLYPGTKQGQYTLGA